MERILRALIAFVLVVGVACVLTARHKKAHAEAMTAPPPTAATSAVAPEPPPVPAETASSTKSSIPNGIPVGALHDLFVAANTKGESTGWMIFSAIRSSQLQGVDPVRPMQIHAWKENELFEQGCSRYRVRLQQGGEVKQLPDGLRVVEPYAFTLAYSVNYCLDRQVPDEGYDVQLKS